jgi:para-aminobenzoate synthetase / 4-amino-4-deoxychorismate lyase
MATLSILTNEVLLKKDDVWLHFSNPQRILQTENPTDIIPMLHEIELLISKNHWYTAGFLSYEAASGFDSALRTLPISGFPLLWFGLYPAPRIVPSIEVASTTQALSWLPTTDRDSYNVAIEQIKQHIASGRTYQVNYTMRLQTEFNLDAWNFFLYLAQTQNNHAAYLDTGRYIIASASPELFFQLDGDTLTCRPMKGTIRRGRTTLEDQEQAQTLKDSEKNRAENVMIVDMIRNDLGRIAQIGSVEVPDLFNVEKYPTLWQMTSTIKAKTSASITEIFKALFPCASITGAPKVSTMQIISELETTPRKIYTGSIGYIEPDRKATFNVAIRTALIDRATKTAEYGVGGGIVWDSTSNDEYAEALLKARVLTEPAPEFSLLETMLWTPKEGFFLRRKHIARLLDSAEYFDFTISSQQRWSSKRRVSIRPSGYPTIAAVSRPPNKQEIIETYLNEISSQFTSPHRIRLLLNRDGALSHEAKSFQSPASDKTLKVCLAKESIDSNNIFLFHKTTHREVYSNTLARAKPMHEHGGYDDVLLYNERDELTEFTIGNLVVEMDGKLYTPPISCGLLAGTFRAHLLETSQAASRVIRVEELKNCSKIFLINSVRKWQPVILLES